MRASLHWIQEYVKLPSVTAKELAHALTMSTVEVEEVIDQAKQFDGIVVGKVLEVLRHPKADRLLICRVDIKEKNDLQIICGGTNVQEGMLVAVAKVGSKVRWHGEGEPIEMSKAKIRGIESNGMIAAANELGLERLFPSESERTILDLSPYSLKVGAPLTEALGLNDIILEIDNKSMTHRPDLWGQYGLAREVAALYEIKLKPLKIAPIPKASHAKSLRVTVTDTEGCDRFSALVLTGVTPKESPWWLKRDLESVGLGSVNTVVDVTNYVMMTLAQPMHAYDYDILADQTIIVDRAEGTEQFKALNDSKYEIDPQVLMIKDGNRSIGIAGIIGGDGSKITEKTSTIVLEAAHFNAAVIRNASVKLGIRTDASSRFEKSLDATMPPIAVALAAELILKIHPEATVASSLIDVDHTDHTARIVTITKKCIDQRLGDIIESKVIISILKRLSLDVLFRRGEFIITIPSHRTRDIRIPEDIVEEVARMYGYDRITPRLPIITMVETPRDDQKRLEREVKEVLAYGFGYSEVYNYSFADPIWTEKFGFTHGRVSVRNALTPEQRYMRTSLLPQLVRSAVNNARWFTEFRMFELGKVFLKKSGEYPVGGSSDALLPSQPTMLSGLVVTKMLSQEDAFREVKGMIVELFSRTEIEIEFRESTKISFAENCFEIRNHDKTMGHFGILKRDVLGTELNTSTIVWWEIQFQTYVKYSSMGKAFKSLPKYPSIVRDLSLLVDTSVQWADIEQIVNQCSPLLTKVTLFDVFASAKLGHNKKSLAFSMTFTSNERTLTSEEVDKIILSLTKKLTESVNARVR